MSQCQCLSRLCGAWFAALCCQELVKVLGAKVAQQSTRKSELTHIVCSLATFESEWERFESNWVHPHCSLLLSSFDALNIRMSRISGSAQVPKPRCWRLDWPKWPRSDKCLWFLRTGIVPTVCSVCFSVFSSRNRTRSSENNWYLSFISVCFSMFLWHCHCFLQYIYVDSHSKKAFSRFQWLALMFCSWTSKVSVQWLLDCFRYGEHQKEDKYTISILSAGRAVQGLKCWSVELHFFQTSLDPARVCICKVVLKHMHCFCQ